MIRTLAFLATVCLIVLASAKASADLSVSDTFARLISKDYKVRKAALRNFRHVGPSALPVLLDRLSSGDPRKMYAAAVALSAIRDRRAVEPLARALSAAKHYRVRKSAAYALGQLGDRRAIPSLEHVARQDTSKSVREEALIALLPLDPVATLEIILFEKPANLSEYNASRIGVMFHMIDVPGVVPMLVRATSHSNPVVRTNAVIALGRRGDRSAVPAMIKLISDPNLEVRKAAVEAFWFKTAIRDERAVPALQTAIRDPSLRSAAFTAIVRQGGEQVLPFLVSMLDDTKARKLAIKAIGQVGGPSALKALIEGAKQWRRGKVIRATKEAVASLGGPKAYEWLKPRLTMHMGYGLSDEAGLLGKTGDPRAVDDLLKVLRTPVQGKRRFVERAKKRAAVALGDIDLTRLLRPFLNAAKRNDTAFIEAALSDPPRSGLSQVLTLYAFALGEDRAGYEYFKDQYELARGWATYALAKAGAFQFFDPPPVPERALLDFESAMKYVRKGDEANAAASFDQALEKAPWWSRPYYNIALLWLRYESCLCGYEIRYRAIAVRSLKKYLLLDPSAPDAADVRAQIEALEQPKEWGRQKGLRYYRPEELLGNLPKSERPKLLRDSTRTRPERIAPDRAPR